MRIEEETRTAIENRLAGMGDYVKMEYLARLLKKHLDFETKRYVLLKLTSLYEARGMYSEGGKLMKSVADIESTAIARINACMKSAELFVKAGNYDEADLSMKKALSDVSELQRRDIKLKIKEMYKRQAQEFIKKDKRKHAMKVYEKMLTLELEPQERKEIQQKLTGIYENLGKIKEYYSMKRAIDAPVAPPRIEKVKTEDSFEQELDRLLR